MVAEHPSNSKNVTNIDVSLPNSSTQSDPLRTDIFVSDVEHSSAFDSTASSIGLRNDAIPETMKFEVMACYLFHQQCNSLWISNAVDPLEGAMVQISRGKYTSCPPEVAGSPLGRACSALNLKVALTVKSQTVMRFLRWHGCSQNIPLQGGLQIQVMARLDDLSRARKHQYAAFILEQQLLVVWDDEVLGVVSRTRRIEKELMAFTCQVEEGNSPPYDGFEVERAAFDQEALEHGTRRPTNIANSSIVAMTLTLVLAMLGAGWRQLAIEIAVDGSYIRILFLLLVPVQMFFTLFFSQVIVICCVQCIGPVKQMMQNSKFYSAILPSRLYQKPLPHVTIQCPVYKESLAAVISPTIRSLMQAVSTYELQGGAANIFINDDGLQVIDEAERRARIAFYADQSIGWTARPAHGKLGFVRRGKFKKASNMNYGLKLANEVEKELEGITRHGSWTQADEALAYERCLVRVLKENRGAWADGNIRIGDYILLVDSDTRVPADCLLDAVSEMEQSPEVGIMQFSSGVMQVAWNFFENGITFFTNLIYTAIRYTVATGDVAPFVGHNAILRWSALQQVSFNEDSYEKFWSESHVSEDFDMALRLQVEGFVIRMAAWAGDGFKEGVSLTVYDELARWEKYAYGCNELLFNPMRCWPLRGPFTPLFRRFLLSNIRLTSKITIISYIGTYYAIGAAWILTIANYFAVGWFHGYLDKYYIDSWKVWISIVTVFSGMGNLALAVLRYRTGSHTFVQSLLENFKWTLMMTIFLGGLSLHVSQALVSHMFEINMAWGATAKELEFSNFFIEAPRVLREFKYSISFSVLGISAMVLLAKAEFVPSNWRITEFVAILPLSTVAASHILLPIALNPDLMTFSW